MTTSTTPPAILLQPSRSYDPMRDDDSALAATYREPMWIRVRDGLLVFSIPGPCGPAQFYVGPEQLAAINKLAGEVWG